VTAEVAFAAGYAVVMVGAAFAIDHIGRASARRRLTSSDPPHGVVTDTPWPELGSIALHTVVATVAVVASLGLVGVTMIRHHAGVDVAVLAVPVVLAAVSLRGLADRLRG